MESKDGGKVTKKCNSYHTRKRTRYLDPATVAYITGKYPENNGAVKEEYGCCFGTKEQEECHCGGDRTRCDFYPEVRVNPNPPINLKDRVTYRTYYEWDNSGWYTEAEDKPYATKKFEELLKTDGVSNAQLVKETTIYEVIRCK
jgi:hypothetical protein